MSHEILIHVTPQETRVAMLEQGVVQERHIERSSARETLERVRGQVAGAQVSAPLGRVDLALQVFEGLVEKRVTA